MEIVRKLYNKIQKRMVLGEEKEIKYALPINTLKNLGQYEGSVKNNREFSFHIHGRSPKGGFRMKHGGVEKRI